MTKTKIKIAWEFFLNTIKNEKNLILDSLPSLAYVESGGQCNFLNLNML